MNDTRYWATWCPPCRKAIPHVAELQRRYQSHLRVVGVTEEDDAVARRFATSNPEMDYRVACAEDGSAGSLQSSLGSTGIPFAVVCDGKGVIVFAGHPMDPGFDQAVSAAVARVGPEPVTMAMAELRKQTVAALKGMLRERGVSAAGCVEKEDLVTLVDRTCR